MTYYTMDERRIVSVDGFEVVVRDSEECAIEIRYKDHVEGEREQVGEYVRIPTDCLRELMDAIRWFQIKHPCPSKETT